MINYTDTFEWDKYKGEMLKIHDTLAHSEIGVGNIGDIPLNIQKNMFGTNIFDSITLPKKTTGR